MAYTIKGLAKANDCESFDEYGLANVWSYWLSCNSNDKQSINDFKRLRNADKQKMLNFLRSESGYEELFYHITSRLFL